MSKSNIITHGGITLDLAQIKSFHIDSYTPNKRSHILKIDLKARYEYIHNPFTDQYEKVLVEDYIEHPYSDFNTAEAYRNEWQEIWEDYVNE
jgi:hypothetical protein